mmetsp:Transcript_19819/g.49134  ORF Transcript_19819/g.49134 Transcript_19819/m.49134 type:complete len:226 (-) Transcript_19819:945-1622(-)
MDKNTHRAVRGRSQPHVSGGRQRSVVLQDVARRRPRPLQQRQPQRLRCAVHPRQRLRPNLELIHGARADLAGWGVDDALQADDVARVEQHTQVRHRVLDLFARIKRRVAHHNVRHPRANERLLQRTRLAVGAIQHRDLLQRHSASCNLGRLPRRVICFFHLTLGGHHRHVLPPGSHGVQLQRRPASADADDCCRRLDDGRRAAVVLVQHHRLRPGKVPVELGPDV